MKVPDERLEGVQLPEQVLGGGTAIAEKRNKGGGLDKQIGKHELLLAKKTFASSVLHSVSYQYLGLTIDFAIYC